EVCRAAGNAQIVRLRGIEPLRLTAYPPSRQALLWREYPGGSDGNPPCHP
ncbi:hypothetical protein ACVW0L_000316, partial [Thermostichus sp. OS-CIW-17]